MQANTSGLNGHLSNNISELLSHYGINPTVQRQDIASLLLYQDRHLSAEDILTEVNKYCVRASKATVYNTLNLFVSKGLLREVVVDPQRIYYDANTRPHYHLYNLDTKKLTDICSDDLEISLLPNLPSELELDGIDIVVKVTNKHPS